MDLSGLEPRRSELARGILIARSAKPLDEAAQRALWEALTAAGVTETDEGEPRSDDDDGDGDGDAEGGDGDEAAGSPATGKPRQWLAAPWQPPTPGELEAQRAAIELAAQTHGLEQIWCVKIETSIDGVAWMELAQAESLEAAERAAAEPRPGDTGAAARLPTNPPLEVLYTAPDAPRTAELPIVRPPTEDDESDDDEDDDEEAEDDYALDVDSHWRNGVPPIESSVVFPIERYPDIVDDYDWKRFGIAMKLAGDPLPGEETVINAFFALWLSAYQDERVEEFEPFQRADVIHDRRHRSALMWVERFSVPATPADQVHFLLWIAARINDVVPLAWARFETIDEVIKARAGADADPDDEEHAPFVLAGNPFAERFRRHGEDSALAWAVGQSAWSKRELAGMLIEVAVEHDPDDPATSVIAERLLRRALAFDASSDATGYLAIVLVRQRRLAEAIAIGHSAPSRDVRLLVVGEIAQHAPGELAEALELLDEPTLRETDREELADLVQSIAQHAPAYLVALLDRLPEDAALVPYLYNASFLVERPQGLAILRRVLALPAPPPGAGEARTALVMAWNNACIHAHALGDYPLAVELADGGQPFGPENPYIYHSAACAYAAVGDHDRAIAQVARAIEHDYEHGEKMETDQDLSPLHGDPRFTALFADWRNRRADLN